MLLWKRSSQRAASPTSSAPCQYSHLPHPVGTVQAWRARFSYAGVWARPDNPDPEAVLTKQSKQMSSPWYVQCRCGPITYYLQQTDWKPHSPARLKSNLWKHDLSKFPLCKMKILPQPLNLPHRTSSEKASSYISTCQHTSYSPESSQNSVSKAFPGEDLWFTQLLSALSTPNLWPTWVNSLHTDLPPPKQLTAPKQMFSPLQVLSSTPLFLLALVLCWIQESRKLKNKRDAENNES